MLNVIATLLAVIAVLLGIIASALLLGSQATLIGLGVLVALAVMIAIFAAMSRENRLVWAMTLFCLVGLAGLYVVNH